MITVLQIWTDGRCTHIWPSHHFTAYLDGLPPYCRRRRVITTLHSDHMNGWSLYFVSGQMITVLNMWTGNPFLDSPLPKAWIARPSPRPTDASYYFKESKITSSSFYDLHGTCFKSEHWEWQNFCPMSPVMDPYPSSKWEKIGFRISFDLMFKEFNSWKHTDGIVPFKAKVHKTVIEWRGLNGFYYKSVDVGRYCT